MEISGNTEITKIADALDLAGWVLYDGDCPVCCAWARRLEAILTRRDIDISPLQSPWVLDCCGIVVSNPPEEMIVLSRRGEIHRGINGILFVARSIWWASPLYLLGLLPGVRSLFRKGYSWLAAHRMCATSHCLRPRTNE